MWRGSSDGFREGLEGFPALFGCRMGSAAVLFMLPDMRTGCRWFLLCWFPDSGKMCRWCSYSVIMSGSSAGLLIYEDFEKMKETREKMPGFPSFPDRLPVFWCSCPGGADGLRGWSAGAAALLIRCSASRIGCGWCIRGAFPAFPAAGPLRLFICCRCRCPACRLP